MFHTTLFTPAHEALREEVSAFLEAEILPHHAAWAAAGAIPREAWHMAGRAGLLCRTLPREMGGHGGSFLESVVIIEELARLRISGLLTCLQSDIVAPFLHRLGTRAQQQAWLPGFASGAVLGAVALSEPQGGSDLAGLRTTATRHGEGLVLDGRKAHISNGSQADLMIVAARRPGAGGEKAISLVLVEAERPGVTRRAIPKSAMPALNTAEIDLDGCLVPAANLLGAEGTGFLYLMTFLGMERLVLAIYAQASSERILRELIGDCDARALLEHQNTRFSLADLYADCAVNRAYLDGCIRAADAGRPDPKAACVAKLRTTNTLRQAAALGVQFRGAAGISGASGQRATQDMLDSAVQSIWGGTSEVMRDVIGRSLGSVL
ncbi:acyl-CoA dehydrogenase family protein [Pseudooceanicola sp. CBS1P-1]|uniref:Acyl-[acyl-carrier-protein] dehydrogenase MbtN n=1 Tax=Pseudooceanicola albus TaxID=2692189 RepID=A0A6L7G8L5_9RHOB|nr:MULTISPECIES: acyl-CoA dehydrogenase family protein [Pseudooceanicola]MBT9386249.1 acyl-CoA dehydrogenase family protein [Pseudooceanicola endophyticus]MXN20299.1 acyl-CoA dehydrogenase [Pseudooceanicola albus]